MAEFEEQGQSDRKEEILSAAFEEFAAKGFKAATIKSIARSAGLASPALIYWYFADKEALFREVVESWVVRAPFLRMVLNPGGVEGLPPEEALKSLGRAYFGFGAFDRRVVQLFLGEVIRRPEMREAFAKFGPERALAFIEGYLNRQVELGVLRPHDTRSSARAFVGMLMPQLAGRLFFPTLVKGGPTDEEHLETVVSIFLKGLKPEG